MSASNDKRGSQDMSAKEARLTQRQKEQQEKKKLRTKVYIVAAALVVLIVFVLVFNSNLFYTHTTTVKVNDTGYTVADFNYYYVGTYNQYYSQMTSYYGDYASMFMPSTAASLRDQVYDSSTGQMWSDVFETEALNSMVKVTMLCEEAEKAGYELSEDELAEIESTMELLSAMASSSGAANIDAYLNYMYGKGMNEEIFRENLTRQTLATSYSTYIGEGFEYSDSELADYYDEHCDEFDYITYRRYFVKANIIEDDKDTEADETVDFDTAMAEAAGIAEDFVSAATDEQSFIDYAKKLDEADDTYDEDSTLYTTMGQNFSESAVYREWLLDSSRKAGDTVCISTGSEEGTTNGYYVLYFIDRDKNDYRSVNGYYAYITPEAVSESDYSTTEAYEEAVQTAKDSAETIMNLVSGTYASSERTYDAFVETCNAYASNFTGSSEFSQVGKNDIIGVLSDWLFDSSRKEGDVELLYDETNGYFLVYYNGQQETTHDLELADKTMRNDDYTAWEEERLADYSYDTAWTMRFTKKMAYLGG
ncbi:MAG: SurA N-terminal domain-containing protein [Oscillospiraceae bacterium]